MIALNNTNKHIELKADKYNDYLKEESQDGVLAWGKAHNRLDKKGREMYQRIVKTLPKVVKKHDKVYCQNTDRPTGRVIEKLYIRFQISNSRLQ